MQLKRLAKQPEAIDAVILSHLHGDHIAGLPFLLLDLQFRGQRSRPLYILGPPGTEERLQLLRACTYPSTLEQPLPYPLIIETFSVPGERNFMGREIQSIRALHDKKYLASSLRISSAGRSLAFSGDTGWQPSLAELSMGADLFICECTELKPNYGGHINLQEFRHQREQLNCKRLILSHMSEEVRGPAEESAQALDLEVADDGWEIKLS